MEQARQFDKDRKPSTINGTELWSQEFCNVLSMQYGDASSNLPARCDGCDAHFILHHALCCKKGGMVIFHHNKIWNKLVHMMASKAFTSSAVRNEPLIPLAVLPKANLCHPPTLINNPQNKQAPVKMNTVTYSFEGSGWEVPTAYLMSASQTWTSSHISNDLLPKSSKHTRKKNKSKYLEPCLKRRRHFAKNIKKRRHFAPFVYSVDGLFGKEATTFSNRPVAKLATKWQRSYSTICGYALVNAHLSIAIVWATHLCLQGSWVPAHKISTHRPQLVASSYKKTHIPAGRSLHLHAQQLIDTFPLGACSSGIANLWLGPLPRICNSNKLVLFTYHWKLGSRHCCLIIEIAEILHKMAAPWCYNCSIPNQNGNKMSGVRFEYPTSNPKVGCRAFPVMGGRQNYKAVEILGVQKCDILIQNGRSTTDWFFLPQWANFQMTTGGGKWKCWHLPSYPNMAWKSWQSWRFRCCMIKFT